MSNTIDINPRKQQLKEEYERLQRDYSDLIARRDDLLLHDGPLLETVYMETIGQLQYEMLCLQYDIYILKLQRDLLQAYINRGERPDMQTVKKKVKVASWTFHMNIQQEEEKIKESKTYKEQHSQEYKAFTEHQSEKPDKDREAEKIELKNLYKRLVHRLHPDLHPEQSEWERELFLKVQEAYRDGNLKRLRELEAELNAGMPSDSVGSSTIEDWEERIRILKEQIEAIRHEIENIENDFPFTYRDKLQDQEWISARQEELRITIEQQKAEKERLQKIVEILRKQANG